MIDGIPGLTIHEHEGRLAGTFELPPADLAAIEFNGRVMLAIVADVGVPLRVTTDTKEEINILHWTFKAVDAAIVRSESLRQHLEEALYLDGSEVLPEEEEVEVEDLEPQFVEALEFRDEPTPEHTLNTPSAPVPDTPLRMHGVDDEDMGDRPPLPRYVPPVGAGVVERLPDGTERIGKPIKHRDATLDKFLNDERDGRTYERRG